MAKEDDITILKKELEVWELKLKILQTKSAWSSLKQAMNQTEEQKPTIKAEEF